MLEKDNNIKFKKEINKEKNNKPQKNKKHKALKIIGIIVFIILVIALILFFIVNAFINSKLDKIKYENIALEELGIDENEQMKKYRNIAILGLDSQYDTYETGYRTDCIMIASINEEEKSMQLYSIYRDTYVQMEENGTMKMDKINHAYYGGIENTLKTINTNLDLNISEYVIADFNAVVDVVDAVGGIDINIDNEEIKYINNYIESVSEIVGKSADKIKNTGMQHLNGVQAVAYCRIRYTSGYDYKRTERMRTVLEKIGEKVKTLNLTEMNDLLDIFLPEIRTNISSKEILKLAPKVLSLQQKKSFGWPYKTKGVYLRGDFFGPAATLESNVRKLHQEVYGQKNYEVPENIKQISDKIVKETGVKDEIQ